MSLRYDPLRGRMIRPTAAVPSVIPVFVPAPAPEPVPEPLPESVTIPVVPEPVAEPEPEVKETEPSGEGEQVEDLVQVPEDGVAEVE